MPGAAAGFDATHPSASTPPEAGLIRISVYDYDREQLDESLLDATSGLDTLPERRGEKRVRWIDISGLHPFVVASIQRLAGLHTLAAEDILHLGQRSRMETYDDHIYLPFQMARLSHDSIIAEQVSLFIFRDMVITFQEANSEVWEPIRDRLRRPGTRLRNHGADYLAYALCDAVIDNAYLVAEEYGRRLETLEAAVLQNPKPIRLSEIQSIRRQLSSLRRTLGPFRKALDTFATNEVVPLKKITRTFLRDALGHADQLVDLVNANWEASAEATGLYLSIASHRMNQVMKVLTILSAIFIPLTFLAGVYGMNLTVLPGAASPRAFWVFAAVCSFISAVMLAVFWSWGWFERDQR